MNILAAIKREERKLELGKVKHELNGVRAAARALGHSANKEIAVAKKRVLSAAGQRRLSRRQKGAGQRLESRHPKRQSTAKFDGLSFIGT